MSTRCIVWFHDGEETTNPVARVYRHYDGYPDVENDGERYGMLHDLARFFEDVAEQTGAVGYDAGYLAAQYVVWESAHYNRDDETNRYQDGRTRKGGALNFSSVYLMNQDPGDIEYRYHVHATKPNYTATPEERATERPTITYHERINYSDEWRHVRPQTAEERERDEFLKSWHEATEEQRATLGPYLKDQPRLWLGEEQTDDAGESEPEPNPEPLHYGDFGWEEVEPEPTDDEPDPELTAGGFQIVERADGLIYSRDPNRENGIYEIVRPEVDKNEHVVICGDDERLTVLHYISNGDGFGREVYTGSKGGYKTIKGARKRARNYLAS